MCGLAGYAFTKGGPGVDPRLNVAIAMLGVFMQDRGKDSWGWTDGESVAKATGKLTEGFSPNLMGTKYGLVHTRYGTTGAKTAENSHPFYIKGILGMHNGMIYNHKEVAAKFGIEYQVDSELIFHMIADGKPLTELEGYGTIVYFQDGKLFMGRFNNRGDLYIAKTDTGWIWASTKTAVESASLMAGITIDSFFTPVLGTLYQMDGDNLVEMPLKLELMEKKYGTTGPTTWQAASGYSGTGYTAPSNFADNRSYRGGWNGHSWSDGYVDDEYEEYISDKITEQTTTFKAEPDSDADEVIDVSELDMDYNKAAEMIMTGMAPIDSDAPLDYYTASDFYQTTVNLVESGNGLVKCPDCLSILFDDELVFVHIGTQGTFCECCYENNYAVSDAQADAAYFARYQEPNHVPVDDPTRLPSSTPHLVM